MDAEKRKTILLVEDEAIIALSQKMALENYGYSVITAISGDSAITIAAEKSDIDLILMDIDLGKGMDGTETAEIILNTYDVPVVFLSSHTEPDIVKKTENITSYGYVVKNSSTTVLDASIKMAFKLFEANRNDRDNKNRLMRAEGVAKIGNWTLNLTTKEMTASRGAEAIYGVTFEKETLSEVQKIPLSEYRPLLDKSLADLVTKGTPYDIEFKIRRVSDGKILDIHSTADYDKKLNTVFGVIADITERKETETALVRQNNIFESLLKTLPIGVFMVEAPSGKPILANEVAVTLLGKGILPDISNDNLATVYGAYQTTTGNRYPLEEMPIYLGMQGKNSRKEDMFIVRPDGTKSLLEVFGSPVTDEQGRVWASLVSFIDITDRKKGENRLQIKNEEYEVLVEELRATTEELKNQNEKLQVSEETLRESETRFSLFMDYLPAVVFLKDAGGRTLYVNKYMDFALGASAWYGKTMTDVFPDGFGKKLFDDDMRVLQEGYKKIDETIPHADGEMHEYETQKFVIPREGKPPLLGGISMDITDRIRAEEQVMSLLAEKELILKEVHHRIKNNMNTIYGLLTLQAGTMKDPAAGAALEDAGSRVQSMMLLYDKLYRAGDYLELQTGEYLNNLIDEIIVNFPNADSVSSEKHIDEFILSAKKLQPLGIIINELLTNIMKYAFTGRDDGKISVSASMVNSNVTLVIADNGNGMPESVDFVNSTGFGLVLVGALTKQLNGQIRIERGQGTTIVLEFGA